MKLNRPIIDITSLLKSHLFFQFIYLQNIFPLQTLYNNRRFFIILIILKEINISCPRQEQRLNSSNNKALVLKLSHHQ